MCGRKTLTKGKIEIIQELLINEWDNAFNWVPSYNIAPTQTTPIIIQGERKRVKPMRWGLVPSWSKDIKIGAKMINARAETLTDKPSYRHLISSKRCIVISDGYYEWQKTDTGKQPFFIHHPQKKLLPMAGLWDTWQDEGKNVLLSYTVITTTPADSIKFIHHRMPVILNEDTLPLWINPNTIKQDALNCLIPFNGLLAYYPVSPFVNFPSNNTEECIKPVPLESI